MEDNEILGHLEEAEPVFNQMAAMAAKPARRVTIGMPPTSAEVLARPWLLDEYRKKVEEYLRG